MRIGDIDADRLFRQGKGPGWDTVISTSSRKPSRKLRDAERCACDSGWVKEYRPGLWFYTGKAAALLRYFQHELKRIAVSLGFEEWVFPRLITEDTALRFGLIRAWPRYLLKVTPWVDHPTSAIHTKGESFILDPVQCAPFYAYHAGRTLSDDELPVRIIDAGGFTCRDEGRKALSWIDKAVEFLRVEYVFAGTPEQVKTTRDQIADGTMALLDRLHIRWRLVVGRGCYDMPTKEDLLEYDRATCVQEIPIYDFELHRKCGGRATWLEFAGCSLLRDRKTSAFGIKRTGGGPLWSGCVGFGLGRLLSVFLSYYGTEEREWPRSVRLGLAEMRRFNGYRG